MKAKAYYTLLVETVRRWWQDNTFQLGAALAFYTVFSLAPVVLLTIAVGGMIGRREGTRKLLADEIAMLAGPYVSRAFDETAKGIAESGSGMLATAVSVVLLIVGTTTVFGQLQEALNTIWGVKARPGLGIVNYIKDQLWSFALVLGLGFLLLVSLVLSAVLAALSRWMDPSVLPGGVFLWRVIHWLTSFVVTTLLFAMIYKFLPAVEVSWRDVWVGGACTALLFGFGKHLIGLYLGQNTLVSAYGAAGSLVVLLLWVYYSSQILLLGAEFIYVYAKYRGSPLVAREYAEPVTAEARAREGREPRPSEVSKPELAQPAGRAS